jgi:hypothetical protein
MRAALAASLALALSLLAAAPGDAYRIGGRAWPDGTINYYTSARGYSGAVDRAARILNRTGLGLRLRRTSRADADVVVTYGGAPCNGRARVGFQRYRGDNVVWLGRGCSRALVTLTAVHEFGHVLGLDHEYSRCARMNPRFDSSGTPNNCADHSRAYWLAHPLTADDLRGLRALYGS